MGSDNKLKYVTSFRDRHGRRRYYFRYRHQKFKLPGKPAIPSFTRPMLDVSLALTTRRWAGIKI
jgi:hypothetical protein